jgi:hypothetical protein
VNKNIEKAARTLVEKILEHPDVFVKKAQQAVSTPLHCSLNSGGIMIVELTNDDDAQGTFQPGKPTQQNKAAGCC